MRLLLYEMLPRRLAPLFARKMEVVMVQRLGWGEKTIWVRIEAAQPGVRHARDDGPGRLPISRT